MIDGYSPHRQNPGTFSRRKFENRHGRSDRKRFMMAGDYSSARLLPYVADGAARRITCRVGFGATSKSKMEVSLHPYSVPTGVAANGAIMAQVD